MSATADPHPVRFESLSETIREAYPDGEVFEWLALGITELGEDPAVILILALVFWLVERERTAVLASYVTIGIAFILLLKSLLAMPRPPEELWLIARDYDPYGFPSGHAFNAVVLYGGFLYLFDRLRDPGWLAIGVLLIAGVGLSRVVLGFHYLGDIVVGTVLGIVFVLAMDVVTDRDPVRGFALAAVVSLPAIVVSDGDPFGFIALGVAIGGIIGASQLDMIPDLCSRTEGIVLTVGGLCFLVVVVTVQEIVAPESAVSLVVVHVLIIAGVLLAPLFSHRLAYRLQQSR